MNLPPISIMPSRSSTTGAAPPISGINRMRPNLRPPEPDEVLDLGTVGVGIFRSRGFRETGDDDLSLSI